MGFQRYHNIVGSSTDTVELIPRGSSGGDLKSIIISNIHGSNDATVSLFLQNSPSGTASSTFYMFKSLAIPVASSLILDDKSILTFDNRINGFGLFIEVGSSDTVDVLINI